MSTWREPSHSDQVLILIFFPLGYILLAFGMVAFIIPGTSEDGTGEGALLVSYMVLIILWTWALIFMTRFIRFYARLNEGRLVTVFPLDSTDLISCFERFLEGIGHRHSRASTTSPLPDVRIWARMRLIKEVISIDDDDVDIVVYKTSSAHRFPSCTVYIGPWNEVNDDKLRQLVWTLDLFLTGAIHYRDLSRASIRSNGS